MSTRDDIAAALNAAGVGIAAKPGRPDTLQPLNGWPQWVRDVPLNACGSERTWWVLVILPGGTPSVTEEVAESIRGPVLDELLNVGNVQAIEPINLTAQPDQSPQAVPALRFTLLTTE
jgi:hypothetical protein